jgi:hypothetical protein
MPELTFKQIWDETHEAFGTVIVALYCLQPMVGLYSHTQFRINEQTRRRRSSGNSDKPRPCWANYVHIWLGRFLLIAGIINGGLGLQLAADASQGQKFIYIIIVMVAASVYLSTIFIQVAESRRKTALRRRQQGEMNSQDVPLQFINH